MPPELIEKLGVNFPKLKRDPHYFLPTIKKGYLLFGSNREETKQQFIKYFSQEDWEANLRLEKEITALRDDVGPSWLEEPLSLEETAKKYVRPELRQVFIDLCRKPVTDYLNRFGFKSDLLKAMFAVTDGVSGLDAGIENPGTGMNFLIHNMCRLPESDGTWMIVKGGMGVITKSLADKALSLGVKIALNTAVKQVLVNPDNSTQGVRLADGTKILSNIVTVNADPFVMRNIVGRQNFPADYNTRLDGYKRDGTVIKVMLALKDLPKFTCLPQNVGQWMTTIHVLPQSGDIIGALRKNYQDCKNGKLPEFPAIEWYIHSVVDPSIQDAEMHHSMALFVQWVPFELKGTTWEKEEKRFVDRLLSIIDQFAPGTSDLVIDRFVLTPPKLEKYFGITRGHIHHVDNSFGFADRLPYNTPVRGLYSCSAGTHPGGSVIGCGGHNSAMRILKDIKEKKVEVAKPTANL
eukprot:TRINITY_DN1496_c0_g1_i1.p1 TRINITY_DN1496_c0_g1~~TRINITY_DN1496_c0_g1_i1.p1  ORF type:complete len:463 (-),score=122.01 TRINITY_DN1496_c0_g1_i1:40-1428(-)